MKSPPPFCEDSMVVGSSKDIVLISSDDESDHQNIQTNASTHQPSLNPKAKAPPNINPQRTKRRISKFSSVLIPFTPDLRYPKRRQSPDLDRPSPPTRRRVQVVIPFVPNLPPRPPSPGLSTPQVSQSWSPKSCSKLRFQSHIYRSPRRTWRAKTFDRRSVDPDFVVASDNEALDTESSLSQLESDSDSIASNTSSHSDDEAECPATMLPTTHARFRRFFTQLHCVGGQPLVESTVPTSTNFVKTRPHKWIEPKPWLVSYRGEEFYKSVQVGDHQLKVGDVAVCWRHGSIQYKQSRVAGTRQDGSGTDDDPHKLALTPSPPRSTSRVRRFWITSLFERDGRIFFHGTRLEEARWMFVGKAADPLELVMLEQCYELEVGEIIRAERVQMIFLDTPLPIPTTDYFCRYKWSHVEHSIVNIQTHAFLPNPSRPLCPRELCQTCETVPTEFKWLTNPTTGEILLGSDESYSDLGFELRGQEIYRLGDHVRFLPRSPFGTEEIGQIVEICGIRPVSGHLIDLTDDPFQPSVTIRSILSSAARLDNTSVRVRLYRRTAWVGTPSDKFPTPEFLDDRRVWITEDEEVVDVRARFVGRCQVVAFSDALHARKGCPAGQKAQHLRISLSTIRHTPNTFYTLLPTLEAQQNNCGVPTMDEHLVSFISRPTPSFKSLSKHRHARTTRDEIPKLRHLELFGGVGSMSVAFMEAGLTHQKTTVFMDWSVPACETVAKNFPSSKVFCADVNDLLSLMVTGKTHEGARYVNDLRTGEIICQEGLPNPGDFDMITAGFPCGSHSTMNIIRKGIDMKNALCGTALSFVEYLKPDYVYFENVRGLLRTSLQDLETEHYLSLAFLRLICGTLMTLDYQVRFGLLQAAQFGAPQERRRVIFSAARRGLTLPKLPEPTHCFEDPRLGIKLPGELNSVVGSGGLSPSRGALAPVTVGDTLADLPRFEYRNPKTIMGDFDRRTRLSLKLRSQSIPLLNGAQEFRTILKTDRVGYSSFQYHCPALNNFQLGLRDRRRRGGGGHGQDQGSRSRGEDGRNEEMVENWHVTGLWSEKIIEQIWHIPFKGGADHKRLPEELKWKETNPAKAQSTKWVKDFEGNFGRLDVDQQFKTIITKIDPRSQGRCGQVLHPTLQRTLTVLEAQRAQGFPDWYQMYDGKEGIKALYRLVGNAIPIPICAGLGRSLWEAREIDWKSLKKMESS